MKDDEIKQLIFRISNINESLFKKSVDDINHCENGLEGYNGINPFALTNVKEISESYYLEVIMEQKNLLISKLGDRIEILKEHITL